VNGSGSPGTGSPSLPAPPSEKTSKSAARSLSHGCRLIELEPKASRKVGYIRLERRYVSKAIEAFTGYLKGGEGEAGFYSLPWNLSQSSFLINNFQGSENGAKRARYQTAPVLRPLRRINSCHAARCNNEDVALSIRAERLISRMFSQITMNRIGKSDTSDRAPGWSQPARLFESKTQRASLDGSSCLLMVAPLTICGCRSIQRLSTEAPKSCGAHVAHASGAQPRPNVWRRSSPNVAGAIASAVVRIRPEFGSDKAAAGFGRQA
jgi:hypothetical protein